MNIETSIIWIVNNRANKSFKQMDKNSNNISFLIQRASQTYYIWESLILTIKNSYGFFRYFLIKIFISESEMCY